MSAIAGATLAILQARALPGMGLFLSAGEVLFDVNSSVLFARVGAPQAGAVLFRLDIPNNVLLVGLPFTIQAGIRVGEQLSTLCNAEDCIVAGLPLIVPDFTSNVMGGAAPLSVQFSDASTGDPDGWLWDFGDGASSDLQNPKYVYRNAGSYDVSLSATGGGSSAQITKVAYVEVTGNAPRNNVLVILADDLGAADLGIYGLHPSLPPALTPNIDALAGAGLLFENAWSSPLCSATRALLMTGRYGFRTGIGGSVNSSSYSLRPGELTLPEAIEWYADSGYSHAYFGKWHLLGAGNPNFCAMTEFHGFDFFEGSSIAVPMNCAWDRLDCPANTMTQTSTYLLEHQFDAASAWIASQSGPWFGCLAPQSPFEDYHIPPNNLQSQIVGADCTPCGLDQVRICYLAAIQAFDTKLGQLIASLGPNWEDHTTIVFSADNGTPQLVSDYHLPSHAKGSLFEGGLHVPMIIAGKAVDPALRGTRSAELVGVVDLFQTLASLTGASGIPQTAAEDSVDLTPLLSVPQAPTGRGSLFAEKFAVNASQAPFAMHVSALRNNKFKLMYSCESASSTDFYDLSLDPFELNNLLISAPPQPGTPEGDALLALEAELMALIDC